MQYVTIGRTNGLSEMTVNKIVNRIKAVSP